MVGTASLAFISGQIAATLMGYGTRQLGAYIGISNIFLLSTFIYATAPASGGHMNPMITFSAMLAGICPVSRGRRQRRCLLREFRVSDGSVRHPLPLRPDSWRRLGWRVAGRRMGTRKVHRVSC